VARRKSKKRSGRFLRICWSVAAFFSLGYFPTAMARTPVISMAAVACLIIPFGEKSVTLKQAAFRGLGLGLLAGISVWSALSHGGRLPPEISNRALLYIPATAGLCLAVSLLFCHVGKKRRSLFGGR
jgi:hypothetical protein